MDIGAHGQNGRTVKPIAKSEQDYVKTRPHNSEEDNAVDRMYKLWHVEK